MDRYHSLAILLLDLMHTLHTRASVIYSPTVVGSPPCTATTIAPSTNSLNYECTSITIENEDEIDGVLPDNLWTQCWCPLLQGH